MLKKFILPGGTRAERDYFHLMQNETAPQEGLKYLNRLSDLLFVFSRVLNRAAGQTETLWQR